MSCIFYEYVLKVVKAVKLSLRRFRNKKVVKDLAAFQWKFTNMNMWRHKKHDY